MSRIARLVCLVGIVAVAGCGGGGGDPADVQSVNDTPFKGGQVLPLQKAPEIGLRSSTGQVVDLASMRGKVVMITFVYARCPDICPAIVDAMRAAKISLGKEGRDVRLVAVSVDPERDTPSVVNAFLRRHRAAGSFRYVVGKRDELEPVWAAWGVAAQESFDNPELVEHSGVVWLVDRDGNRAVYFPVSSVNASDLAHDARVLLSR